MIWIDNYLFTEYGSGDTQIRPAYLNEKTKEPGHFSKTVLVLSEVVLVIGDVLDVGIAGRARLLPYFGIYP